MSVLHYDIFQPDPADRVRPTPTTTPTPSPPSPSPECPKCKSTEVREDKVFLEQGGYHLRSSCASCGKFRTFIPHGPAKFHFGKYCGRNVADVAAEDLSYLRWALRVGAVKGRVREAIREAVAST